ncbi:hypothetical protein C0W35_07250 [Photobacterium kishitanii]|uniref:glycosyltransferase n=1 Tax=Photobacterium kishitanii TaxID=318456 RepID=UPI000D156849|nr:glycosyltransferase [Photobacterium kishitanii]PSU95379.1 hypothetical protein C0W35_07250 [Photobacterium kishitanii]
MKKLNILFVINDLGAGGAERVCSILANYFSDIYLITIVLGKNNIVYELNNKIKVDCLDFEYQLSGFNKITEMKKRRHKLKKYLTENQFDIIVSFGYSTNMLVGAVSVLYNEKIKSKNIIYCEHNNHKALKGYISTYLRNKLYQKCSTLVSLTEHDSEYYRSKKINSVVINNPINKTSVCSDLTKNNIIFIGRLEHQKNIPELILVIRDLVYSNKDYNIFIIGQGSQKKYLLSELVKLNLLQNVKYIEMSSMISDFYANARALILVSHYEGLPMVLIEALSYGVPQVSYNCPTGPSNIIIDNITGRLIPHYDRNSFVAAVNEINDNDKLAMTMSMNSIEESKKYQIDNISSSWNDLFKRDLNA